MASNPLVLTGATKRFTGFTAVDRLDLSVERGSIVGFLGPNGAGKSTSLRMALGIMTPDEGEARLFGERPGMETLRRVGFLPEERGLYKKMNPVSTIQYFARLKGMSAADAHRRAFDLLEASGLQDFARSRISKLSKGMAQKVQILATLAHQPDLLILDEPFSGLDPVNQQALETLIREQHQRGATIVFSTHVMEHAERLCDKIVMMARGRKVFDGTLEDAFGALGRRVRIAVSDGFDLGAALAGAGFSAIRDPADEDGTGWAVSLPQGRDAQDALRAALAAGAPISGFAPEEARLRDVFISLAGQADAENDGRPGARSTFAGAAE
ncbi:MAG: ATP-binding cassette domain-containing protein [Pseudomonadota bacterium]